jgi:hypothetical protein
MKLIRLIAAALLLIAAHPLYAAQLVIDGEKFHLGVGLAIDRLHDDTSLGFQILGGYPLEQIKLGDATSWVEAGFIDLGSFKLGDRQLSMAGLWASYLLQIPLPLRQAGWQGLLRIGVDFGDDDGLLFGAGIDYALDPRLSLRGEYVMRDQVRSWQLNAIWRMR